MKKTILGLLVGSGACWAQSVQPDLFTPLFNTHIGLAGVILTIGIFLTGIVYMIGSYLMNEKIKAWAKTEMVEIFYSGVILAIVVSLYTIAIPLATTLTYEMDTFGASVVCNSNALPFNTFTVGGETIDPGYGSLPCHLRVAKNFLASVFYETAALVKSVGTMYSFYTFLSSFSIDFIPVGTTTFFSAGSFTHSIFGFLNAKINALAFIFEKGILALTVMRFQEVLINFIGTALFPVLLTAGIILRTFSLTRKLGGLLMAIALSLYFIYPIFYIVGDTIYNSVIIAQNYNPAGVPQNRVALARIFVDLSDAPSKFNVSANESFAVNTQGENISFNLVHQLGVLTATQKCQETIAYVNSKGNISTNNSIRDDFGSTNKLLGTWLEKAFTKGGKWNPFTFNSILVGIDVLAKAMFFSMFFSFLSIFTTIAAIKSLSPMLGGDIEIAGLTHLI